MALDSPLQFFPNDLQLISIDEPTLRRVLVDLRAAVRRGIDLIRNRQKVVNISESEEAFGNIFAGSLGIALAFLRLETQACALSDSDHIDTRIDPTLPEFRSFLKGEINPRSLQLKLQPGQSSPLASPSLGAAVIRILATVSEPASKGLGLDIEGDIAALHEAVEAAIHQDPVTTRDGHSMGGDEVLSGRAGLLWALMNIERHNDHSRVSAALQSVLDLRLKLRDAIVDAGRRQAEDLGSKKDHVEALPLMWPWVDDFYGLGAVHGITHEDNYSVLGNIVTDLCRICIEHNGHLPMAIPPWPSSRQSPLVQLCHGTPGILLLLAAAKGNPHLMDYQTSEWDEATRLGSERVWEQGLLSKGGGLCHGIAGNAWPWLLLHERALEKELRSSPSQRKTEDTSAGASQAEELPADYFLSRALTFLLAARDTRPFAADSPYRMPDRPFSLFEGLAGTVCAWSEACVVIMARLRLIKMQTEKPARETPLEEDEEYAFIRGKILGFPSFGGMGPSGCL